MTFPCRFPSLIALALTSCVALASCGARPPRTQSPPQSAPVDAGPPSVLREVPLPSPPTPETGALAATSAPVFQHAHRRAIADLAFHPDGRTLAAVSPEGTVSVIDVASGRIRASRRVWIRTAERRVLWLGHRLVVASSRSFSSGGGIRIWDVHANGWSLGPETTPSFDARLLAAHPSGEHLYFVERDLQDGQVSLHRRPLAGGEAAAVVIDPVERLDVSPDGRTLLLCGEGGAHLEVRDALTLEPLLVLSEDDAHGDARYRPTGGAMVLTGEDRLHFYDPGSAAEVATFASPGAYALVWSAEGSRLLAFAEGPDDEELLRIHDGHSGLPLRELPSDLPDVEGAALGDGVLWVTGGERLVRVDLESGDASAVEVTSHAHQVAISPDGTTLAVADGVDVVLLDATTGAARARVPGGHGEHSVWGVRWAPDGQTLATWGRGGVELWGHTGMRSTGCAGTGSVVFTDPHPVYLQGETVCNLASGQRTPVGPVVAFAPGGARLATDEGDHLTLRDPDGEQVGRLRLERGRDPCRRGPCRKLFTMTPDGAHVAFPVGPEVRVARKRHGEGTRVRARIRPGAEHSRELLQVMLAPDGGSVVLVREGPVALLHQGRGGRRLGRFPLASDTSLPAFAPDGAHVAIPGPEGIHIVVASTGEERTLLATSAQDVTFSAGGDALIAREDTHVWVWDLNGALRVDRDVPPRYDVSADGEALAYCERGLLIVAEPLTNRRAHLGECAFEDTPVFAPDGQRVALRRGAFTEVFRRGTEQRLTLRTLRVQTGEGRVDIPLAYDAEGHFQLDEAHVEYVLLRDPGPLRTAPLHALDPASITGDLVASFFRDAEVPSTE